MKLALASLLVLTSFTHAHAEDTGMKLMQVMMRCPAISSDSKHVAIYSLAAGKDKAAKTSLAVFGGTGKLEQRIDVVPPNTDAVRATSDAAKISKVLDDGAYKRMSRVAQKDAKSDKATFTAQLSSEDAVLDVKIAKRKVTITGTRAGKKLAAISKTLPKDGPCKTADSYDLPNTMAGFDATSGLFAFEITVTEKDTVCFAHDFVVKLK